jgi:RNA polymerase sigma-70 factor (ECF subfamily)
VTKVAATQGSTPEQFSEVFREHLPALTRYLSRRVVIDDVEDLAANVFEIAWMKRAQVVSGEELPWLYRIAAFQVANYRRRLNTSASFMRLQRSVESAPSPEALAVLDFDLAQAWKTLTPGEAELLALVAFEDLPIGDAAKVLQITPNAASLRLLKARKKLEAALAETQ